jgi:hypothetical protein
MFTFKSTFYSRDYLVLFSGSLNFSGETADDTVQAPKWSDSAEQRWKTGDLSGHYDPYGMPVDEKIWHAQMERQPGN